MSRIMIHMYTPLADCGFNESANAKYVSFDLLRDVLPGQQQPTTKAKQSNTFRTNSADWHRGLLNTAWSLDWTSAQSLKAT